jgi:hypothetical protein
MDHFSAYAERETLGRTVKGLVDLVGELERRPPNAFSGWFFRFVKLTRSDKVGE